jgi:hypothetical protein
MLTKIEKWLSIPVLILAILTLLWPSASFQILLAIVLSFGVILAIRAHRAGKYFWEAGYTMVSRDVNHVSSETVAAKPRDETSP